MAQELHVPNNSPQCTDFLKKFLGSDCLILRDLLVYKYVHFVSYALTQKVLITKH